MRATTWLLGVLVSACLSLISAAAAAAPQVQLRLESREVYAGLPFNLVMEASGFAEEPQPSAPTLDIAGAKVTYLGVNPNVSQQISIINGQRSESRSVTFAYRWRVEVPRAGSYTVPALELTQGDLRASTRPSRLQAGEIEASNDMQLRLNLPDRPVWVGETFTAEIEWLLTKDVQEFDFVVPLFEDSAVRVAAPQTSGRTINFNAGAKTLPLPLQQDQITESGVRYGRFRFPVEITAERAGPLAIEPIRVVAQLAAGAYRDRFGFRRTRTQLFQASSDADTLVVRALPLAGRPDSFVNAIGSGFGIDVSAARTVVQVGDPVEIEINIRGDASLDGISLPRLHAAGLPSTLFGVAAEPDVGESTPTGKTFRATVRVLSDQAREIPALSFAYFDPGSGAYQIAESRPIALSVSGANLVGAEQVTSAVPTTADPVRAPAAPSPTSGALVGADMALSAPTAALTTAWRQRFWLPVTALLYGLPLAIAGLLLWWRRSHTDRRERGKTAAARKRLQQAIASTAALRDSAPEILTALRAYAEASDQHHLLQTPVVARLETVAYDPAARDAQLSVDVRQELEQLLQATPATATVAGTLLVVCGLFCSAVSEPASADDQALAAARAAYAEALTQTDRIQRVAQFENAERLLGALAAEHPDAAALQADWGNAALGAQRNGLATLAFRRALHYDPGNTRALTNLNWLRDRQPAWLPRLENAGAFDTLLFWQRALTPADRYLLGGIGFALMIALLFVGGSSARRLAVLPGLFWLACTASALLDAHDANHAVVTTDGAVLRSADSVGAAAAFAEPLPAGAEVVVLERRDGWYRVSLGDGSRGWLRGSAVSEVLPADREMTNG